MTGPPITVSVEFDRPQDEVFAHVDDPSRFAEWQAGVVGGHMEKGAAVSVGSNCMTPCRIGGAERGRRPSARTSRRSPRPYRASDTMSRRKGTSWWRVGNGAQRLLPCDHVAPARQFRVAPADPVTSARRLIPHQQSHPPKVSPAVTGVSVLRALSADRPSNIGPCGQMAHCSLFGRDVRSAPVPWPSHPSSSSSSPPTRPTAA